MVNRITDAQRHELYARVKAMLNDGETPAAIVDKLLQEGISKQRTRHTIAKVRLNQNRPENRMKRQTQPHPETQTDQDRQRASQIVITWIEETEDLTPALSIGRLKGVLIELIHEVRDETRDQVTKEFTAAERAEA